MYSLDPPAVYVHESVMADERYRARVDPVVQALEKPVEPVVFNDAMIPQMVKNGLLANRRAMGTMDEVHDPILLFHTFRFDGKFDERYAALKAQGCDIHAGSARSLLGYGAFGWACYNQAGDPARHDKVCRPCWRIHLQQGCVHRCHYCGLGGLLVSMVNVEDYCHHLGKIIERHPWQDTYLLDDDGDPPCLEPEHGVLGKLMEYFGTLDKRYLIVHTKTWNTEWMRDVNHNGNTIVVWSISGPTQSRLIEPKAGDTDQRIEAARTAQEAGVQIRYKFKPIVPVKTWREDAAYAVKRIFERTEPDLITLCLFMWHKVDEMKKKLPLELLDEGFLKAAEDSAEAMANTRTSPYPPAVREEVYDFYLNEIRKYDKDIPVSLSTENFPMWKSFGPKVGFTATNYVCGCGPQSTPGAKILTDHAFKVAVRDSEGLMGVYG